MLVTQLCLNSLRPYGLKPTRLLCPWNSPGKNTGVGCLSLPSPGDVPNPGIEPESPALQANSLLSELPGKLNIYYLCFKTEQTNITSDKNYIKPMYVVTCP